LFFAYNSAPTLILKPEIALVFIILDVHYPVSHPFAPCAPPQTMARALRFPMMAAFLLLLALAVVVKAQGA
jgi:hypothetical protein